MEAAIRQFLAEKPAKKLSRTAIGQFLVGSATKAVTRNKLTSHPLFGSLEGMSRKAVVAALDRLTASAEGARTLVATAGKTAPGATEQVPRRTGLAILQLLQRWPEGLPRSGVANVLRGVAWSDLVKKHGAAAFPELGVLSAHTYEELVQSVDRMTAKGYCEETARGRVRLSTLGRETLERRRITDSRASEMAPGCTSSPSPE